MIILIDYLIRLDCGMPNRIIKSEIPESDGKLDPADLSFPWNALLYVRNESGLSTVHRVLCAATLIGKSAILTTADCLMQDKNSSVMAENVIIILNPSSEVFSENLLDPKSNVFNVSEKDLKFKDSTITKYEVTIFHEDNCLNLSDKKGSQYFIQ